MAWLKMRDGFAVQKFAVELQRKKAVMTVDDFWLKNKQTNEKFGSQLCLFKQICL